MNNQSSIIAKLDSNFTWSHVGNLNQARGGHNVIVIQNEVLIVGGYHQTYSTERCIYRIGQMNCTEQLPELTKYTNYPELLAVPNDFCVQQFQRINN